MSSNGEKNLYVTKSNCNDRHKYVNLWNALVVGLLVAFVALLTWGIVTSTKASERALVAAGEASKATSEVAAEVMLRTALVDERQKSMDAKLERINAQLEKIDKQQEAMMAMLRDGGH